MLDMADVPQRRGELTAPCDEKPEGSQCHVTYPHGSHAVSDQREKKGVCHRVPIGGLFDKPKPESSIRFDRLIEESADFESFNAFLRIGLHALDALPALDAVTVQEPPHLIDRQTHAQDLLVEKQRPREMATENQHDADADSRASGTDRENPQRDERQHDIEQGLEAFK